MEDNTQIGALNRVIANLYVELDAERARTLVWRENWERLFRQLEELRREQRGVA